MIERLIYECEYCNKKRLINKTQMKKHEDICWYNPKNKTCLTCNNYYYEAPYREPHPELEGCPSEFIEALKYCEVLHEDLEDRPRINCKHWKAKEE